MVQKTDLRIGNLVKAAASFTGYLIVEGIASDSVQFAFSVSLKFNEIEPVELTPEILVDTGFVFGRKFCGEDFYDVKIKKDIFENDIWEFKRNNESLTAITSFHQLQNLYYALSGEELEITF